MTTYVGHPIPIQQADDVNLLIKYLCFMLTQSWVPAEYPPSGCLLRVREQWFDKGVLFQDGICQHFHILLPL